MTITNGPLSELCTEHTISIMERLCQRVARSQNPRQALDLFDRAFPKQMKIFESFVTAFFGDEPRAMRSAHKKSFPAYRRYFADGAWIQVQFEAQAIEMQTEGRRLPDHLRFSPQIDRHFFAIGRTRGLKPDRRWGMGHVSEDIGTGYEAEHPAILRNRVVREFNDVYFWTLVGENVEADVHWDVYSGEMENFGSWLEHFDFWLKLRSINTTEAREKQRVWVLHSLKVDPIFARFSDWDRRDLYAALSAAHKLASKGSSHMGLQLSGAALQDILINALKHTQGSKAGTAFAVKAAEEGSDARIEFRRVPSHQDADQAAMWIHLIEGRWRQARQTAELLRLVRPTPPANDRERIELFERFILEAGSNPRDFATFLPARLAWRIRLKTYPTPRWSEVRRRILCEEELVRKG